MKTEAEKPEEKRLQKVRGLYALLISSVLLVSAMVFFSWYDGKAFSSRQNEVFSESLVLMRQVSIASLALDDYRLSRERDHLITAHAALTDAARTLGLITRRSSGPVNLYCPSEPLRLLGQIDRLVEKAEDLTASLPSPEKVPSADLDGLDADAQTLLLDTIDMQTCLSEALRVDSHNRFSLHLGLVALMVLLLLLLLTLFYRFERRLSVLLADLAQERDNAKEREEAIARRESDLHALVETSQDAIFIETVNGRILDCNQRACDMHGYTREEMLALDVRDLVPSQLAQVLYAENAPPLPENGITIAGIGMRKDGSLFPTEVSLAQSPLADDNRVFVYLRDISQRKEFETERTHMQARLQHQQKLESIGTLASGVAHEINNPINIIINYAELISSRAGKKEDVLAFASEISHESERIATIVRNLLAFSRHEKEGHSPARIEDIIHQTLSIMSSVLEKDQIQLDIAIAPDLPSLKCRSQQIQQVIMNLLTNARDTLNEKYPGYDENKKVQVRAGRHPDKIDWMRISVEDHGTGIPVKIRDRIFDPFFTTKARDKGTGLGLSVSHGIVREHRGDFTVESEEGVFTRFNIDLPINNGWKLK
jgi:PAS domain S-box-containing protein